jgi:hypothetical protein
MASASLRPASRAAPRASTSAANTRRARRSPLAAPAARPSPRRPRPLRPRSRRRAAAPAFAHRPASRAFSRPLSAPTLPRRRCGHNLLLAHGRTYRLYQEKYAPKQGGKLSMALDGKWGYPYTNSEAGEGSGRRRGGGGIQAGGAAAARSECYCPQRPRRRRSPLPSLFLPAPAGASCPPQTDKAAAQKWVEFSYAWMADPCYFGDYPASMRQALGSALPTFTPEQSAMLKGSLDFFGVRARGGPGQSGGCSAWRGS